MPNRPGVYPTGEDRGVRPYGAGWRGPWGQAASSALASADEFARGVSQSAVSGVSAIDDALSGNAPWQQFDRQLAADDREYALNRSGVLTNAPFSRQAYTMGIDRAIEDAPHNAAEAKRVRSEQATLMDLDHEDQQEAKQAEVEQIRTEGVMQGINQILGSPIGKMIQSQLANQAMPMSPTSPFALQPKAKQEDIRSKVDLKGSYTKDAPTYTAPKQDGNIGTIDLRADAPVTEPINPRNYFEQMALAHASVGDTAGADRLGRLSLAYTNADRVLAETDKTKIDSMKSAAEYEKLVKELESGGASGIDPERLAIAGNQAKERRTNFVDQYVEYQTKLPKNVNISPEELPTRIMEWRAEGDDMFKQLGMNQSDIKIMDALEQMFSEDSTTSKADAKRERAKQPEDRLSLRAK